MEHLILGLTTFLKLLLHRSPMKCKQIVTPLTSTYIQVQTEREADMRADDSSEKAAS